MIPGLFITAPSRLLNPTLDQARIDAAIAEDPEAGRSEWLGLFRSDISQFLPDADLDRAVVPGRRELPYLPGCNYAAFADPSGGRHDAMTLAISHPEKAVFAHAEGRRVVLDRLVVQAPPFDPEATVQRFAETLRGFGLRSVTGDRYAAEWVATMFSKYGIRYEASDLDKSAIYVEALPLFAQGQVELLEVPQLATQLRMLERRPRPGGKGDVVDHPPRGNDDAANSACGALWLASKVRIERRTAPVKVADPYFWDTGTS